MKTNNHPKRILLLAVMLVFTFVLLLASCTGEGETSADTTTESAIESTLGTTPDSTTVSSPESSTEKTPETTVDDTWKEKLAEGLYEKTTVEDEKYYVSVSFSRPIDFLRYMETYSIAEEDVIYGLRERYLTRLVVIRAHKELIETIAKEESVVKVDRYREDTLISWSLLTPGSFPWDIFYPGILEEHAVNQEQPVSKETMPLVKLTSLEEKNAFVDAYKALVLEEVPDWYNVYISVEFLEYWAAFDEAFFEENALLLTSRESYNDEIVSPAYLFVDGDTLTVRINIHKEIHESGVPTISFIHDQIIILKVNQDDLENVTRFDLTVG